MSAKVSYVKVAELLDSVADYIDGIEHSRQSKEASARGERISLFASQYELSTGQEIPSDLRDKLAGLDQDTLDHILKVANNSNEEPNSLGGPARIEDKPTPRTTKEAADQAGDRFLNWIVNE